MRTPPIRAAAPSDLDSLVALETESFGSDRLSMRSFRHFITAPTAACRVFEAAGRVVGYALTVFRKGSRVARVYSVAVAPEAQGQGIASALLADAERIGAERGAERVSLEVRGDNPAAIRLYERLGYAFRGIQRDYYEDGADARRYEKRLDRSVPGRPGQAET